MRSKPAFISAAAMFSASGTYSGSLAPRTTFEASKTNWYWLSGTPIRSHTILSGSRAEISVTASHSPLSITSSTIVRAVTATSSTRSLSRFGVNPRETMRRRRACRGSSISIMEPKNSRNSGGMSLTEVLPFPETKIDGVRLASTTSACRVSA